MPPLETGRPAVQYLRRSTGLQAYSIDHQRTAIAAYAADRGYRIVRTFSDDSSGLDLKGRPGLRDLLVQALAPNRPFEAILVYDVSRWGRFQDLDQGAHYEFLCRRAGLAVEYCAEPFDNDGSPEANLIKQLKRSMAAEYSRQLSERIVAAKRRQAALGHLQSGPVPYGLRRLAVDQAGTPRARLERGEKKVSSLHPTIVIPGPPEEVATVRRIFQLFAVTGMRLAAVAELLTREGVDPAPNKTWNEEGLRRMMRNDLYVGDYVFGRSTRRLATPRRCTPPDTWVRAPGAYEPIVSREVFEAAGRVLWSRRRRTDAEMIDELRVLAARGKPLSASLIDAEDGMLSACSYIARFGGLGRAYALAGYVRTSRRRPRATSRRADPNQAPPLAGS